MRLDLTPKGVADSTQEHERDILKHRKGWNKFYPTLGVGIDQWIHDETSYQGLRNSIIHEFRIDGLRVRQISIVNEHLDIIIDEEDR